jgi:hypothetical protein
VTKIMELTIEQRLQRVETRLDEISDSVRRLSERTAAELSARETSDSADEPAEAPLSEFIPPQGTVFRLLTQVGRGCLIFGGAFLVRALTDSGTIPRLAGAAIGLAYACVWVILANRAARRGRSLSADFLGVTGVLIADPLIFETTVHFKVLSPAEAAIVLAGFTGICLAAAWRGNVPVLAWAASLAASTTALLLSVVTGSVEPFAATLLLLGIVAAWRAGTPNGSSGLQWPLAAAADGMVLWSALHLADFDIHGSAAPPLVASGSLAVALPVLYLSLFAVRAFTGRREATNFEILQTWASVAIGLGTAFAVARMYEQGEIALGAITFVGGMICTAVAFGFIKPRMGRGRTFLLLAALGLALTISGSALAFRGTSLLCLWCGLALACAFLGSRAGQPVLVLCSAAYCMAAAWQSGLMGAAFESFVAAPANAVTPFPVPTLIALGVAAGCGFLLLRETDDSGRAGTRFARLVLAAITVFGFGGFAVAQLRGLTGRSDSAAVAALRTAVLATSALVLAAFRRRTMAPELRMLAYALLVVGGAKLFFEDLRAGSSATLFVGFGFYGIALLAVPRLLKPAPEDSTAARSPTESS